MFDINERRRYGKVVLAPMAGYTFYSYRKFMKKFGVNFSYTEMVSDMGILYENEETLSYLKTDKSEYPLGLQLFGHDPKTIAKACKKALEIEPNFAFIDVNCGCPVVKVNRQGAGSSLLRDPNMIKQIIIELKKVTTLPVSIKIRLGWNENEMNYLDVVKAAQEAGVDFIAVHARTRSMLYSGKPIYEAVKEIKDIASVPIIYSGDIFTLDDAIKVDELVHPDYIMVARGGVGNPYLIKQIDTYFKTGKRLKNPSLKTQKKYCLKLARMVIKDKGEETGMKVFRSIGPRFFTNYPNAKKLRVELTTHVNTYSDLKRILKNVKTL